MSPRRLRITLLIVFIIGLVGAGWHSSAHAAIDCTTEPTSLDGRCLNQAYFSGTDFGASITNGGYGGTGVFANVGTPSAGNSCFSFQNTLADIASPSDCSLWSYTDSLGSDGLDKWAFPNTIDNGKAGAAQAFVNFIGAYLNDTEAGCSFNAQFVQPSMSITSAGACQFYRARILGAAYIVLTMVGGKYTTYDVGNLFASQVNGATGPFNNVQAGIKDARNEFSTWSQEVLAADAAGNVNWNIDTPASISFGNHPNTSSVDYDHDEEMRMEGPQARHSITFNTPGGQYIINRRCGNTDSFSALAPTGFNMHLSATGTSPEVQPGGTGQINMSVWNTGPSPSQPGFLEVQWPGAGAGVVEPCGGNCSDPGQSTLTFGGTSLGYTHAGVPGITGPDWYWGTAPFPNGQFSTTSLIFSVPASAAPGSTITILVCYFPSDPAGDIITTTVTFTVGVVRYPSVVGEGSDIHAGGGACNTAPNIGFIDGNPNGSSYGDYAVSASSSIGDLGSNGSPTDPALKLGPNGSYSEVCRPDLYANATNNPPAGVTTLSSGPYNLNTQFNSSPNAKFVNGKAVAYITGPVTLSATTYTQTHPLTLVVSGDVKISGNIKVSGSGVDRNSTPSLGIIASGAINITDPATTVNAMLFSDDSIDTCFTTVSPMPPGLCDNVLTVHGFLMAPDILLHRLGS